MNGVYRLWPTIEATWGDAGVRVQQMDGGFSVTGLKWSDADEMYLDGKASIWIPDGFAEDVAEFILEQAKKSRGPTESEGCERYR